ncbi:MAG: hypothetical protein H0X24_05530 [Ktedonobacterales bacterium]|nr:hypothetical protein [Ktedonobacterales bacterium]
MTTATTIDPQADQILQTAHQNEAQLPEGWTVIPVNRQTVQRQILGWSGSTLLGLVLGGALLAAIYPTFSIITLALLAVLAFLALGSLWLLIRSARLLMDADRHLIVLTPDLYVQQRGSRIISVPMGEIDHITLRGVFGGDPSYTQNSEVSVDNAVLSVGRMLGGSRTHRARRTPDSLAFVDARTDAPIMVAEDNSFAELPVIEELLRNYVNSARNARKV